MLTWVGVRGIIFFSWNYFYLVLCLFFQSPQTIAAIVCTKLMKGAQQTSVLEKYRKYSTSVEKTLKGENKPV